MGCSGGSSALRSPAKRNLFILLGHFMRTIAKLLGPGGAEAVAAKGVLMKQQLLVVKRSRRRCPPQS
ncbi:MAG: hypothetical protein A2Y74_07055 [Actinobacteria bacterium RBG_13_63_9]|nr:MAG: hypothetical protein A2Y74_07055 [Actinobacteria bacterium RBG_13_63_9]